MVFWLALVMAVAAEKTIWPRQIKKRHSDSKKHMAAGDDPRPYLGHDKKKTHTCHKKTKGRHKEGPTLKSRVLFFLFAEKGQGHFKRKQEGKISTLFFFCQ